ncbi:MAG: DNA primase [Bacteroidales bacterium]|nr:DNA primase [Bacteroidales bacterium]
MIPQETVDRILDTARIDEVVGDFVTLRKRGSSLWACCPFHNEKTPSFHVEPSRGIYKCFGCGKSGTAVGFVMEHEHFSYYEALKYLANKYHIEVKEKEETVEDIAARQRTESLMLVSEFAQKFFVNSLLHTDEGRNVGLAYLHSRGLDDETIERFGLGWAPSGWTALTDAALAEGYKAEYLVEAGLCIQSENGRVTDRFHERAMFPIHSMAGRVIAYSGRTLHNDGNIAKYVNSPETPIYVKSRALYGIWLAKGEISKADKCFLAEGNVDVVSMHQLGLRNVVASCGTSLTEEQIRIIKKFTGNITVMYDGDKAGIHAAQRAIGMILKEGMNVSLVLFPDGDDPDSFCRKHTLEEVQAFIAENEKDFVSYMALVNPVAANDPLGRANLINEISDTVALIPDAVKRSVFVDAVSQRFGVETRIIFERINADRRQMREDEQKEAERARRRAAAGLQPDYDPARDETPAPTPRPAEQGLSSLEENKTLAPAERELLSFIMSYGTSELDFESDSDYYSGSEDDKPTVADFIRASLEADGISFANKAFRDAYDAYMREYDEGYEQDEIVRTLLNSPDRTVAFVAAELSMEKHQLTVKNFEQALTTTSSWLVNFVPKAILVYAEKRIEDRMAGLIKSLATAPEGEQTAIMAEMQKLSAAQKRVKVKIGREKV